ncbi:MAG: SGNH/GDSL hydrolase family protein [Caldimonas sp.]
MLRLPRLVRSLVATLACLGAAAAASAGPYDEAFFFGDSLSDAGNVAIAIGANPGQVITGNTYIPSQPYASGQFSDGDVWARTFSAALGIAPSGLPSLSGGGNYAFGGARIATDGAGLPPSLAAQQAMFLGDHAGSAPADALYVIAGGGNDARDAFAAAAVVMDPTGIIAAAASAYAMATGALVDQLQAAGAAHIVVWDVPNLGLAPRIAAFGAGASFLGSLIAQSMNGALEARLAGEAGVSIFDVFGLQTQIAANPAGFGLVNATDACGGIAGCDASTYLFWDGIHPTEAGHDIFAQGMLVVVGVPEPAEIALMLAGLALVGARTARRRRGTPVRTAAR